MFAIIRILSSDLELFSPHVFHSWSEAIDRDISLTHDIQTFESARKIVFECEDGNRPITEARPVHKFFLLSVRASKHFYMECKSNHFLKTDGMFEIRSYHLH